MKYSVSGKESLREKQSRFARMVCDLMLYAFSLGFELTLGHALRCPECPTGKKDSNHKVKLAIDLNLFSNGKYLDKTEDHALLGKYWESLSEDARWGGRFKDGNHYSLEHNGVK